MMIDYKKVLNEQQYDAATHTEGPLLIIAGAGTGKTATLIHRVAYMIENGIRPETILLLTFTNKAADEMKERASKMLDERCSKITACTYHSFCARMLRLYSKIAGLPRDFTIITESDISCTISLIRAARPDFYNVKGMLPSKEIAKIFSMSINKGISIAEAYALKSGRVDEHMEYIYEMLFREYNTYKRENNLIDYDDLLLMFSRLLNIDAVREQISDTFKYIMVDEYQDTNNLQEEIIVKLSKKYKNIAVVGDDYQSIYAFRGSNINNFIDFPNKFKGCHVVKLVKNYRSTTEILNVANAVMNMNADFGYPKDMLSNNKAGAVPYMLKSESQEKEAADVAGHIIKLHEQGIAYKDIAVLQKKSADSSNLEIILMNLGIPFKKVGGPKFMEQGCIQDILGFLRVIANPIDTIAWFRVLHLIYGIGDTFARNIVQNVNDAEFLLNTYPKRKFHSDMTVFHHAIKDLREEHYSGKLTLNELLKKVEEFYFKQRKKLIETGDFNEEQKLNEETILYKDKKSAKQLMEIAKNIGKGKSLNGFLDKLTLGVDTTSAEDEITISTVHSAKGLEWEYVFVMDCVEGVYPGFNAFNMDKEEIDEVLRVFYVVITRAKTGMYLCVPETYRGRITSLTQFLRNIKQSLYKIEYAD